MLTKFVCCNRLVILSVLLHQVHAEEGRLVCTVEDKKIMKTKAFELSDAMRNKSRIMKECGQTRKLILESGSILTLEGDDIEDFVHWLFWEKELEMCVAIVNNAVMEEMPVSPKSIKRTCEGPLIRIVNNTNLYRLTLNNKLVSSLKSVPDAIRIRGNRKLRQTYLEYIEFQRKGVNGNWDLQPLGECPLPAPFTSFDTLDRNCTNYYGALMLEQGITELPYNSSEVHKFNIDGCIQIENTELKDITFLMGFSRFRRMQSCEQFIRNNKRLCSKNLNYLNVIFKDIQFSNNGDQFCSECIGGQVSKHYLEESLNCSLIYGDLIISNFRGLPSNFENLRSIETIEGRLIIINNTGLYEFDYLASLKIVGRNTGGGAAIIVKDNADLSLLALPNLLNLRLNKSDGSVELANNPMFTVDSGKSAAVSTTTPELYTSIRNNEEGKTVAEKNSEQGSVAIGESRPYSNGIAHRTIIFGGVAAALVLILMCSLASFLMCRQEINTLRLPQPPYELYAKSQEKLGSLCLEILERNPTIWSTEDFNILWKCGPHTAREIAHPSSRHAEFIKSNMIPTTNNGNVSQQKDQRCQKYRARELLRYDLVIMIGNTNNVREVVSDLPRSSGDISTYTDEKSCISIAYKLLKVREFSSKLTLYKYEAKDMNKNEVKSIEILLYQWSTERLPTDFTELLQLVALAKRRNAICASNRRKEVFSMLSLLHACVVSERLSESVVGAFQLHSQLCNGAPLDRFEMLYLMRTLLHWGSCARCIQKENREEYALWCQTYDYMADFSRKHRSIMNIHPVHLGYLHDSALANTYMDALRRKAIHLSDRPYVPIGDRFQKTTPEEMKKGVNEAIESTCRSVVQSTGTSSSNENENSKVSTSSTTEQFKTTKSITITAMASRKKK